MKQTIVVIGGGIMGLSCAWRLAEKGHNVTVLEKEKCGSGSTCASLGALVPYNPWREDQNPTNQRNSLWSYPTFAKELLEASGIDIGFSRLGRLLIIQSKEQLERLSEGTKIANEKWPTFNGKPAQKILTKEELQQAEPEVNVSEFGALYCRASAQFTPSRMIAALRAACMRNGVDIRENSPAIDIIMEGKKVTSVRSATGLIKAESVILAAGAWSKNLLPKSIRPEKYVKPIKGQSLELSLDHQPIKRLIKGLGIYLMPIAGNKIWVGGTKETETGFNNETTEEAEDFLLNKAEQLMPILAEAKIVKQWSGLRPYSEQKDPIVGWDKEVKGLYHLTGHGGIGLCLAPYTSKKVAEDF